MKPGIIASALLAALLALAVPALAQDRFPAKPVQIVVALASATPAEILARMYAEKPQGGNTFPPRHRQWIGELLCGGFRRGRCSGRGRRG